MNFGRMLQSAIARRIAYVIVALLFTWAGMGRAEAAQCNLISDNCTSSQAHSQCMAKSTAYNTMVGGDGPSCVGPNVVNPTTNEWSCKWLVGGGSSNCGAVSGYGGNTFFFSTTAEEECPGGYAKDPFAPTQCLDEQKCLARNESLSDAARPTTFQTKCNGGCSYGMFDGFSKTTVGTDSTYLGVTSYSGAACGTTPVPADDPAPEPTPQECVQSSTNKYVCGKANGEQCYTMSPGNQACWMPGETGEKVSADVMQKRVAGPDEIPPASLALPNGDTLVKQPPSVTTTHTTVGGSTIITTTTNYTTINGTNAGGGTRNDGEPADGSGGGDDEGDENGASGGVGCEPSDKPVVSGDPLLSMITIQAWATRCAVESKDAITSTGDVADCSTTFTLSGPPKSSAVLKLKALRKSVCGDEARVDMSSVTAQGMGTPDAETNGGVHPTVDGLFSNVDYDAQVAGGGDVSGFGFTTSACPLLVLPSFVFRGQTMTIPWIDICTALEILAGMILLAGHIQWAYIVAGLGNK